MRYNNAKAQKQAELEDKKSRILDDIIRKEEKEFHKKQKEEALRQKKKAELDKLHREKQR